MDIQTVVNSLVESEPDGINGLAKRMKVSVATVSRWMTGRSRPRPILEGRLRDLGSSTFISIE